MKSQIRESQLPDVAVEKNSEFTPLDWVGMEKIFLPLTIKLSENEMHRLPAKINAFVSLDLSSSRGIHMSRLYTEIQTLAEGEFTLARLSTTLKKFLSSHEGLSHNAKIEIDFELPLQRSSLKSGLRSWRNYPLSICALVNGDVQEFTLQFDVEYSSTCPASTALAREVNKEAFLQKFAGSQQVDVDSAAGFLSSKQGLAATPHAQRSRAQNRVRISSETSWEQVQQWISAVEVVLKTPVQGAVKREDEQEFARLNGQNPLFCEDAARKIHQRLDEIPEIEGYIIKVEHFESLHSHNAVSVKKKNFK